MKLDAIATERQFYESVSMEISSDCCLRTFKKRFSTFDFCSFYKVGKINMVKYNRESVSEWCAGNCISDDLVSMKQAPSEYDVSYITLYRAVQNKEIDSVRKGVEQYVYVSRIDVEKLSRQHRRYNKQKGE